MLMKRKKGQVPAKMFEWLVYLVIIIIIICYLQNIGVITPKILPDSLQICQWIPGTLVPPPPGNGVPPPPPPPPPEDTSDNCDDPDAHLLDEGIWLGTAVTDHINGVAMHDECLDVAILHERICNWDGTITTRAVDCRDYGAWCIGTSCAQSPCESIVNPTSQSSCDGGTSCTGEEDYCKYIPADLMNPSKCVCTIAPEDVVSCWTGCWFEGYGSSSCSDNVPAKNPCSIGTWFSQYDTYCPFDGFLHDACCCF